MRKKSRRRTPSATDNGLSRDGSEFDRFERLTKRLVSVPKKEITEAEKSGKKRAG